MESFNQNNSVLRICVDRGGGQPVSGRVFSRRLTQPISFTDVGSIVLELDGVFDQQSFPQAFQRTRTFLRDEQEKNVAAAEPSQGMSEELIRAQRGEFATFEVIVTSRRNSSWQGAVDWLDGSERQEFASFLDLLRLVYEKLHVDPT